MSADARFFLDTNAFVYTFDASAPAKRETAVRLIERALAEGSGVISTQVVQEFLNVATRKFRVPLSHADCVRYLDEVLSPLCEVFPSMGLYRRALAIQSETRYSYYDSLVLAAAAEAGCSVLYSEDMQDGRCVAGVTVRNPFA
jgi:predicted nucleic acid-binding protein